MLSRERYIPCNAPAVSVLYSERDRRMYRMCDMCADHNTRRGMRVVSPFVVGEPC